MTSTIPRRSERAGMLVLAAALLVYAVWQIVMWSDPWSSWGHIETVYARSSNQQVVQSGGFGRFLDTVLSGTGIDTPTRFRPLSHAVQLIDAAAGSFLLPYWFAPVFANPSSVIYFLVCPVLALLVVRRMLGCGLPAAIAGTIAAGALLTSVGYISASGFLFHPAKKLVVVVLLLQWLLLAGHVREPGARLATLIGLCQLLLAWSDESGLFAGLTLSVVAAAFSIAHRRWTDVLRLGAFGVLALAILVARVLTGAAASGPYQPVDSQSTLQSLLAIRLFGPFTLAGGHLDEAENRSETYFNVINEHLEAAFSVLYGPPILRWLLLFGLVVTIVTALAALLRRHPNATGRDPAQSAALFLATAAVLAANAIWAILLLSFGGRLFMSGSNFYYASFLAVLAFFVVVTAFRFALAADGSDLALLRAAARTIQASLGIAVAASILSNVQNEPRLNRLVGMLHFNPYSYGQVNSAAASYRPGGSIRIARCTPEEMSRRFEEILGELDMKNPGTRADFLHYPARPFADDRFLQGYLTMLLRQMPPIEYYPARPGEC